MTKESAKATSSSYFVHYTCDVMGKRLEKSKVFEFDSKITQDTFDGISSAIAQHENVASIVITNFIEIK